MTMNQRLKTAKVGQAAGDGLVGIGIVALEDLTQVVQSLQDRALAGAVRAEPAHTPKRKHTNKGLFQPIDYGTNQWKRGSILSGILHRLNCTNTPGAGHAPL